jgi:hypothetical protein
MAKHPRTHRNGRTLSILPFCLALLLGCSGGGRPAGKLPELHPARGKVTRSGRSVAGGVLQFRAEAATGGSDLNVTSVVRDDGSFELSTTHALSQRKAKGAPAGEYTITYLPPGETQDVMPVTLPDKVTISNGPNELAIELGDE